MPLYTTTATVSGLLPDTHGPLVVQPALDASVFAQVATAVTTESTRYRIPIVSADPTASWVAEGAEITPSDPTPQELVVTPAKVAGLTVVSRELADDSDPAAANVVGDGLARDIARRIDQAAFAGLASPAPAGLSTLSGVQVYVNAGAFGNLDFAAEAISKAETVGATVTAFVTSPATALALAKVKTATGRSHLLDLGADSAQPNPDGPTVLRYCVDWTEQRHHLAGAVGTAVASTLLARGWITRAARGRAVHLTDAGQTALTDHGLIQRRDDIP